MAVNGIQGIPNQLQQVDQQGIFANLDRRVGNVFQRISNYISVIDFRLTTFNFLRGVTIYVLIPITAKRAYEGSYAQAICGFVGSGVLLLGFKVLRPLFEETQEQQIRHVAIRQYRRINEVFSSESHHIAAE